jgi:septum site-determining protein MinC
MPMIKGACELKSAQFSLMRLAIYQTDANAIQSFVADQVSAAPELLDGAPVALDFSSCGQAADAEFVEDMMTRLRYAGMQPIAVVAEPDSAQAGIAKALRLGVLAPLKRTGKIDSKVRPENTEADYKVMQAPVSVEASTPVIVPAMATVVEAAIPRKAQIEPRSEGDAQTLVATASNVRTAAPAAPEVSIPQRYEGQVRSGQQLYAKGRDLIVTGAAGASSEVISDGSIHIYGRLMGKVIAGASGDRNARIYCLAFGAELVSIAGVFRVFEAIPLDLVGKSVQIWLDGDKLRFDILN